MTCHNYLFLTPHSSFFALSLAKKKKLKQSFAKAFISEKSVVSYTYTTLGLKANTNILLWLQAETIEEIQVYVNTLLHTSLGEYLSITHTLLGMSRPTQYSPSSQHYLQTQRKGKKYLVIYPFSKTKEWYTLDFNLRRKLMGGHVLIGKKYSHIDQILLYSYGIDDYEFIVSYETNNLLDFQNLVMELRSDPVRAYTLRDTPIFTCIYRPVEKTLEFL